MASKEFKKSFLWSANLEIIVKVCSFLLGLLVVRYIAPEDLGNFYKIYAVIMLLNAFSSPGFFTVILSNDKFKTREFSDAAYTWDVFVANLLVFCIGLIVLPVVFNDIPYFYFLILLIPFFRAFQSSKNFELQYDLNYKGVFNLKIIPRISSLMITLVLLLLNFGVVSIIIGEVFAQLSLTLLSKYKFRKNKLIFFSIEAKELIRKGYFIFLSKILRSVRKDIDKLVIIPFISPQIYAAVNVLDKPSNFLLTILRSTINKISLPYLSKYQEKKTFNLNFIFILFIVCELLAIPFLNIYVDEIVIFLFTSQYVSYSIFLIWGVKLGIIKYLNSYLFVHFSTYLKYSYEFFSGLFVLASVTIYAAFFWNYEYLSLLKFFIFIEYLVLFILSFKLKSKKSILIVILKIISILFLVFFL